MYNNKLKAIVLPVVIALAIVLGMGINSLLDHTEAILKEQGCRKSV